ncbi:MAG: 5'-3' exonuclease H3TH domain-containing protein, partial [Alphaproteobacteria bacterium]
MSTDSSPEHVVLIDGSGFIFRAFFAIRQPMNRSDGTPVAAVYGFTNMLMKLLKELDADRIAVIFDYSGRTFRNEIYPQYKANRPPAPEDLVPQFPLIRDATRAFNLPCIEKEGFEADDLIATYTRLAREAGSRVTIVSSDKDMMQLVGDQVTMYDGLKGKLIGIDEVAEKFGVGPERVIDVQALAGDSSDNVPGVPGIGVKTAAELINTYGDLDTVLARAEEVKQPKRRQSLIDHAEAARMSRTLVTLRDDVPLEDSLESLHAGPPDAQVLTDFLRAQDFGTIIARVESWLRVEPSEPDNAADEPPKDVTYELVQDRDALQRWIDLAERAGAVTIDTETTSLDALQARLVGISLSVEPGQACYIPLGHGGAAGGELDLDAIAPKQIAMDEALGMLAPLLADRGVLKIGQNIKYDMEVLAGHGIEITPVDDTMLLSFVLDGGLHGHGMDELSRLHLGVDPIPFKQVAGTGKKQITFDQVPLDAARDYAAEDA